jgi:hypothetical protein
MILSSAMRSKKLATVGLTALLATVLFAPTAQAADSAITGTYPCSGNEDETRPVVKEIAKENSFTEPFREFSDWDGQEQSDLAGVFITDDGGRKIQLGVENYRATITMRYSQQYHCVWGLINLDKRYADGLLNLEATRPTVWVDLSFDGGQTIYFNQDGYSTVQSGNSSTYTPGFGPVDPNDPRVHASNEIYTARVCGHGTHEETGYGGKVKQPRQGIFSLKPKGPGIPTEERDAFESPTVCTPWQVIPA